jgi:ATP-dependent protease ClpP protease subunit
MQYRLVFNGGIYLQSANALRHRVADILGRADCEGLTILFSSEGGSTDEGIALYNFIKDLPRPVNMHAVGHVGSMGVPVFCAGAVRTCSPISRSFFHTYDWGFDGRQTLERIDEAVIRLKSDIQLSSEIVGRHSNIDADTLAKYYGTAATPTVMTPKEAVEKGLCSEITELNPNGEHQANIATWTVGW